MKKVVFLAVICTFCIQLKAQDTLVYAQKNAVMFSNSYSLYTQDSTFKHQFKTDDGQIWLGKGTYTIKGNNILFNFEDVDSKKQSITQITKIYNKELLSDTLIIKLKDVNQEPPLTSLKFNNISFYTGFDDGIIKIAKSGIYEY